MDLSHFDLNLLRALDILLEERNVTRAAKRLFVSQQAASGSLQRLRTHFEDELLTRIGRHLEPTPLARSLMVPVREALLAAQAALDTRPVFDPATAQTDCRIAMSDYGLFVLLPLFLQRLTEEAPNMRCHVEPISSHMFEHLASGDIDFCMTAHDPRIYGTHRPGKSIRSVKMFDDDFVCIVDPGRIDISDGLSLAAYRRGRHNSVAFGEDVATIVESGWKQSGYDIDVAVVGPTFSSQIFMLPGTPIVATAQRRLATALAPRLGLAVVECPMRLPKLQENLMWHERTERDPAHHYLAALLRASAAHLT